MCLFETATPDYFRVMGIQLIAGRPFNERDTADAAPVAIIDESLARKFFPTPAINDAIGKRVAFEFRGQHGPEAQPLWREVVGVASHVRHYGLVSEPVSGQVYAPFQQLPTYFTERRPSMALLVRTSVAPDTLAASIRREVAALDKDIPVYGVQTLTTFVDQTTETPRLSVELLAAFGVLALVLAVLGIYGVLSYLVSTRMREIGIRLALGATAGDVLRLVVGQGMAMAACGIAVGLLGAWLLTESLRKLLFEVSPHDATTYGGIVVILLTAALVASYLPGRRATRVDPATTLRSE
jgi:putative ABC transport system permease protein